MAEVQGKISLTSHIKSQDAHQLIKKLQLQTDIRDANYLKIIHEGLDLSIQIQQQEKQTNLARDILNSVSQVSLLSGVVFAHQYVLLV